MLKPKSQIFKLKFHLSKVEAVNNKVNSKVHAYLHIDNQQLQFKGAPELKKNVAIFGSDLQYDNFMINFDQITGLYEQKKVLLVIQFETQGAYIKIGEVNINVGQILNEKKYRVVNVYPLSKCYDKSAKAKLALDFIPISQKRDIMSIGKKSDVNFKQSSLGVHRKQQITTSNLNGVSMGSPNGFYKNPTGAIKSRLAQQQNVILQQRVYEYEKRMDNYRIAQNELSQRMQQQLQRKDEKISQLSLQHSKQQNTIHLITLQNQSFKSQLKSVNQQLQLQRLQIKQHLTSLQTLHKQLLAKQKQLQSKHLSLQNLSRTKQNKQKHLALQIQKYTSKYSQSEQERNKIIFQLENKLKIELEKKDHHYQDMIRSNEGKFLENMRVVKDRNKYLEARAKELEEIAEQQDNKIKALTLELQKSQLLSQQEEEEMVYLNQEFGKLKKTKQSLINQLDSLNFSYQETSTELTQQKDLTKQMVKKIQLLKTQLSLSNQTVQQQRQRIIIMSKDIQVHQQREYYMKEHYQQQIYDRELSQNNVRGQKGQLIVQLKRSKQQLKLAQQKHSQQQTNNQHLKSTLQSLQKQLITKNSSLMKLGQQQIYLQTENRNSKILITELSNQLTKLQSEKGYLSEALMEKKLALENDKSLQWTYKIQSLQNDIQLMVEKFKAEKELMKEQSRKEDARKIEEINKITQINKKIKEQIDEARDKLSKKQNYALSIEKTLKSQKQKSIQLQRQLSSIKESHRLLSNKKQTNEQTIKQLNKMRQSKDKQMEELDKKSEKYKKQLSSIKNGFNRLISLILEHMVKRYNQRSNFQDISNNTVDVMVDGQIIGYVNVALKKFCDDHNKTREMIKQLQEYKRSTLLSNGQNSGTKRKTNRGNQLGQDEQNRNYTVQEPSHQYNIRHNNYLPHIEQSCYGQRNYLNKNSYHSLSPNNRLVKSSLQSPYSNDPVKELQSYRYELDKLKKDQSQWKVKTKALQEELDRHQRQHDNQKFEKSRIKSQLEECQDQMTRINFTLRKKDKIIKELQMQMQDLQKQNYQLKSSPSYVIQKAKQKLSSSLPQYTDSASLSIVKDLQSKLSLKSQELQHVQKDIQSLRQQYLTELNQIKKLESKMKQKSARIISLEKQIQAQAIKRSDEKDKQIVRLKKAIEKQAQEREKVQDRVKQLENVIKQYDMEVGNMENRNKQLHEQIKVLEQQNKRSLQSTQYKLNDKSTFYETQILQFKSQLSQQRDKCQQLIQKNSHLNLLLSKKVKQLQTCRQKLSLRQKQLLVLEQEIDELKNRTALKNNELNDKIRELQNMMEGKSFELEECRFAYEGRVLELQRQIDQCRDGLLGAVGNHSVR